MKRKKQPEIKIEKKQRKCGSVSKGLSLAVLAGCIGVMVAAAVKGIQADANESEQGNGGDAE